MKKSIFYTIAFAIVLISCHKENNSTDVPPILIGKWELRQRVGGNTPDSIYAPGNGNICLFTKDSVSFYKNGATINFEAYKLRKVGDNSYTFNFLGAVDNFWLDTLRTSDNKLSLIPGNPNASTSIYEKLNP